MYGTTNSTLLLRVQKLQHFAAKACAGRAGRSDHATLFITQPEWLKIEKKAIFEVVVIYNVFKMKSKLFLDWFMQFPTNNEIWQNKYTTRQHQNLHVSHTNTDYGARSFIVRNDNVLVNIYLTLHDIRKRLKAFLKNNNAPIL